VAIPSDPATLARPPSCGADRGGVSDQGHNPGREGVGGRRSTILEVWAVASVRMGLKSRMGPITAIADRTIHLRTSRAYRQIAVSFGRARPALASCAESTGIVRTHRAERRGGLRAHWYDPAE
jgi:hypothetical protein